ncbi:MAG: hypothetical protein HKN21_08795, partial [Candidatus Eisenbacteria bacterium]|nr:hypothetical protein [Candidatus Eisenbacteria bacterium]
MRRLWFLFILPLLCLGTVPVAHTAPFQLSESQLSAVEFEVQFPVPTWTTEEINGETYRYLTDLDCSERLHQLDVQIPAQVFEVAVPPTGQLEIETQATTRGSARGVRFPPALVWEEPEASRLGERKAATRQIFNLTPNLPEARTPQARLLGISTERGLRIARIEVAPVVWDPSTNTAVWAEKVNVRVRVSGAKPLPATRPVEDQVGQQAWKTRLVNPESAARWQQARQPDEAGIPERWFDDATQWVKLRITENGMYGITPDDLEDLGIDVSAIDPRQFRLMAGPLIQDAGFDAVEVNGGGTRFETRYRHVYEKTGFVDGFETTKDPVDDREGMLEHSIWITGSTDGSFDSEDVLHFYALGPDNFEDRFLPDGSREEFVYNSYTDETVYWLTWDFQSAEAPKRMPAIAVARLEPASIREVTVRGHFEGNTWYDPSMYVKGERWEEWFW